MPVVLDFFLMLGMTDMINILLVVVFLFLGFKVLEGKWSYRISKPYAWEEAVSKGLISKALLSMERTYRDKVRFYTLWLQTERITRDAVAGSFAEVGVYKGATARILHALNPARRLHLFDTFEGFAKADLQNETIAEENKSVDFSDTGVDAVRAHIRGNENLIFHPGYFPATTAGIDEMFSLVHLDADLYQPTLAALRYFYPRLSPGGVIIVHDYNHTWGGVRQALAEFLPGIPETLSEVADWQGSALLIRNRF